MGEFRLDDPLLDEAFGLIEDAGTPIVIHVGSGPVGNEFTGPEHLERLLRRHPRLTAVVAHMGAPEYDEFLALAEAHENTRLDTTMVFTELLRPGGAVPRRPAAAAGRPRRPRAVRQRLPDDPLPLPRAAQGLTRLGERHPGLGEDWLRRVCWHNAVELFGLPG